MSTSTNGEMMETTWIVQSMTETPGRVTAELQQVSWFKTNPEFTAVQDVVPDENFKYPDEFIDALPGEEGAEYVEEGTRITLDVTDGLELHPLDNVRLHVSVMYPSRA